MVAAHPTNTNKRRTHTNINTHEDTSLCVQLQGIANYQLKRG